MKFKSNFRQKSLDAFDDFNYPILYANRFF